MNIRLISLLLIMVTPIANALDYTPLKKALLNFDAQHYSKPMPFPYYAQTGQLAFSVNDPRFCSPKIAYQFMLAERPTVKVKTTEGIKTIKTRVLEDHQTYQYTHKKGHKRQINVKDGTSSIVKTYNLLLKQFITNGDFILQNYHICVGFMDVYAADARSALEGIILFDPRIYQKLDEYESNMHSYVMIELHELAHQLQFIHKMRMVRDSNTGESTVVELMDQFLANDKTVKRFELTADCMAAAMTSIIYPIDHSFAAGGLMMAGVAYGDFYMDKRDHHGQPLERAVAVRRGIDIIKARPNHKWQSKQIMQACEAQVKDIQTLGSMVK